MTITLPVTLRDEAIKNEALRASGMVPAVVYGPKHATQKIVVDSKVFDKVLKEAGEATIVSVTGLGAAVDVLIKDVDFDPIKRRISHVDFYAIEQGKEMTVTVPFEFTGEAPVLKAGAVITKAMHEIEVTCMPQQLPAHITVDLTTLENIDDKIHVSDLPVLKGVTYEAEPNDVVAVASAVEEEPEAEEADLTAIEVEKKGKTEAE